MPVKSSPSGLTSASLASTAARSASVAQPARISSTTRVTAFWAVACRPRAGSPGTAASMPAQQLLDRRLAVAAAQRVKGDDAAVRRAAGGRRRHRRAWPRDAPACRCADRRHPAGRRPARRRGPRRAADRGRPAARCGRPCRGTSAGCCPAGRPAPGWRPRRCPRGSRRRARPRSSASSWQRRWRAPGSAGPRRGGVHAVVPERGQVVHRAAGLRVDVHHVDAVTADHGQRVDTGPEGCQLGAALLGGDRRPAAARSARGSSLRVRSRTRRGSACRP